MTREEAQSRRQELLAARAECLAKMTEAGRHALEQRQERASAGLAKAGQDDSQRIDGDSLLAREVRSLIAEANRLRESAESQNDVRAALKGMDTALRALALYGRATGEINTRRTEKPPVDDITRDEGIEAATELLLQLATSEEIEKLITQLRERLKELTGEPLASDSEIGSEDALSAEAVDPNSQEDLDA